MSDHLLQLRQGARRGMPWWAAVVVFLAALGAYANSLNNGFALDDCGVIQHNAVVESQAWERIWQGDYWPTEEGPHDVLYRPLTVSTYALNEMIAFDKPFGFHVANVALHCLVSVLVAWLAWKLTRGLAVAVSAGVLFAIHPIHTEVVANVVGRAEILAAFWMLLALVFFLPDEPLLSGPPAQRPWWHGLLVAVCFFLALLSKETPAAMVFGFVFLDMWRWSLWAKPKPTLRQWLNTQVWRYHVPIFAAFAAYMTLRIKTIGLFMETKAIHPVVNPLVIANWPERIFTPFVLLTKYIVLLCWPKVLSSDYSAPSIPVVGNPFTDPLALLGMLIAVSAVLVVITKWKRAPLWVLLIVWFGLSYMFVSNFIRIGTIFGERLFYWPSVFVLIMVPLAAIHSLNELKKSRPQVWYFNRLAGAVAACVVILLGYRTIARNPDWHDNDALALATAMDNPGSAKACSWAGTILTNFEDPSIQVVGEQLLKQSIALYPTMGDTYWSISKFYGRTNRFGKALVYMAQGAYCDGGKLKTRRLVRLMNIELKVHKTEEFMPDVERFLAEEPNSPSAHFAYGIALWSRGKVDEADVELNKALMIDPRFPEAHAELALLKLEKGDTPAAVMMLRKYVQAIRFNLEARCELADALMKLDPKHYPTAMTEAAMNLDKAERLIPNNAEVRALRSQWKKMNEKPGPAIGAVPAATSSTERRVAGGSS